MKRIRWLVLAWLPVLIWCPSGTATQGANVYQTSSSPLPNGVHAYIWRNGLTPASQGRASVNVRIQPCFLSPCSETSQYPGIIQIGFYKAGPNNTVGDCPNPYPYVTIFFEWGSNGNPAFQCDNIALASTTTFGQRLGVVSSGGSPDCWNSFIDGAQYESQCVNFSQGTVVGAGGEYGQLYGGINACWGCNGGIAWQYTNDRGASYHTIGTSGTTQYLGSSDWVVSPPPSPFNIHD